MTSSFRSSALVTPLARVLIARMRFQHGRRRVAARWTNALAKRPRILAKHVTFGNKSTIPDINANIQVRLLINCFSNIWNKCDLATSYHNYTIFHQISLVIFTYSDDSGQANKIKA